METYVNTKTKKAKEEAEKEKEKEKEKGDKPEEHGRKRHKGDRGARAGAVSGVAGE